MTKKSQPANSNTFSDKADWLRQNLLTVLKRKPMRVILATPVSHLRHPLTSRQLSIIFERDFRQPKLLFKTSKLFFNVLTVYLGMLVANFLCFFRNHKNKQVDIVFKTWIVPGSNPKTGDFYFGNIPTLFEKTGVSVRIIGGKAKNTTLTETYNWLRRSTNDTELELSFLPWKAPIAVLASQLNAFWHLHCSRKELQVEVSGKYLQFLGDEILAAETFRHALHYYIAKAVASKLKPIAYITLYEGQPWERQARLGVKQADPHCVTTGYQHTPVMPVALELHQPLSTPLGCDTPEAIFTSGRTIQKMLETGYKNFPNTKFFNLGSHKRNSTPALHNKVGPNPANHTILVALDGTQEDAVIVYDFAIHLAKLKKDWTYIFRCHPVLGIKEIQRNSQFGIHAPSNTSVSQNRNLEDDLRLSSVLLYRASSIVFNAVLSGIKPVYIDSPGSIYLNAYFDLHKWKIEVRSPHECRVQLDTYFKTPITECRQAWQPARIYTEQYIEPISIKEIQRFITEVMQAKQCPSVEI